MALPKTYHIFPKGICPYMKVLYINIEKKYNKVVHYHAKINNTHTIRPYNLGICVQGTIFFITGQ